MLYTQGLFPIFLVNNKLLLIIKTKGILEKDLILDHRWTISVSEPQKWSCFYFWRPFLKPKFLFLFSFKFSTRDSAGGCYLS